MIVSVPAQDRPFLDRWGSGPVSLIGDAAHPMLTSIAQGASSAIEDGYVLREARRSVSDPVAALRATRICAMNAPACWCGRSRR